MTAPQPAIEPEEAERIAGWLRASSYTVVLTGAGISTESGIPDFRGPEGVWTKNPEAEKNATLQHFLSNREIRIRSWKNRLEGRVWQAEPNAGHFALAELEARGRLQMLVTQNVDGLHVKAGSSPDRLVEIHGTVREFTCMGRCGDRGPIEVVLERVRAGEEDPRCKTCDGILKSATISFGQNLVPEDIDRSERAAARAELFLAVGTSLTVYPVALLPERAIRHGARFVIINAQETPYDAYADMVVRGQIGEVLPAIVALV